MLTDDELQVIADRLTGIDGVVGVILGGSRAREEHTPKSDWDVGLYYEPPLDVEALAGLAREVAGPDARVTAIGEWGPWVDGGGWLIIAGSAVDWLYRDLRRVRSAWADAQQGRFTFHAQVGHPLGVPDFAYAGEVALGRVLADPTGQLADLHSECVTYPPRLAESLVDRLWEASFMISVARKAAGRGDTAYIAGCLFRVVGLCAHALHGRAGRWLINEKGAVQSAGSLPIAPRNFTADAQAILAHLGDTKRSLEGAIDAAERLVDTTSQACTIPTP